MYGICFGCNDLGLVVICCGKAMIIMTANLKVKLLSSIISD